MTDISLIPHYSLSPNSLTLYHLPDEKSNFIKDNKGWDNLKDNTNKYGELSPMAQKRLRKKINYLMYLSNDKKILGRQIVAKSQNFTTQYQKSKIYADNVQYKLTFITLTLPAKQRHSDNEIKKSCLNQFLVELRHNYDIKKYIWKAEKQANGNIHFHIIADNFIQWQDIRSSWNRIVNKLGYVDDFEKNMREFYKDGFKLSTNKLDKRTPQQQKQAYKNLVNSEFKNPNSTDIHALYKVKNIQAYMSKYLTKGVTKTDRIALMDDITNEIEKISTAKQNLLNAQLYGGYDYATFKQLGEDYIQSDTKIQDLQKKLIDLKEKGIIGNIWGCSSDLSKCENYTDVGDFGCIPEFDVVAHIATFINVHEVGAMKITTFYFDINKTVALKLLLDNHIRQCLS